MNPISMLALNPLLTSMNREMSLMHTSRHHSLRNKINVLSLKFARFYIIFVIACQSMLLNLPLLFCSITQVEDPTFSLGVTQEDSRETAVIAKPVGYVIPRDNDQADNNEGRKSKRTRVKPAVLDDFQCEPIIGAPYVVDP